MRLFVDLIENEFKPPHRHFSVKIAQRGMRVYRLHKAPKPSFSAACQIRRTGRHHESKQTCSW